MAINIPSEGELVEQFSLTHTELEYEIFQAIQSADPLDIVFCKQSQAAEYLVYMDQILNLLRLRRTYTVGQLARSLLVILYGKAKYSRVEPIAIRILSIWQK